jgi:transposase InsO family protein
MSEWFTALELANARLPGLPHSKRKVNAVAAAKGWATATGADGTPLARKCSGRGGGVEYHISLLPPPARTRLEARAGKGRPETENDQDVGLLGPKDISRRDARLFVVARADDLLRSHPGYSRRQADEVYAAIYNSGAGDVPDWVRPLVKGVSRPTIERWRAMRGSGRFDLAAGRHSLREGCREIERLLDGEIATFIGALIVKQPFLTAPHIRGMVEGKYGPQTGPLPSERTFQRFISDWKARNAVSLRKLTDPDGYKSGSRLSGSNSNAHVTGLNQLWEIDASPADVLTTDGRHAIYVVIDIWSRRMMTLVTRTPRTEATLQLIRRAILAWGVPRAIKTDNGSDFTSQRFVAAMNSIGIAHETSDAFSPEQKGTVERAIGTLQRGLMRVLPGFTGHSVADRKVIEQRKAFSARLGSSDEHTFQVDISAAELQTYCDEWCETAYGHHPHKGLGGMTPFLKAQSWLGRIDTISNERALDLLLMPTGWRQATKQGIQLDKAWFISPDLMPGTRVFCRQDPADMGRLHCFESEGGAYITTAICPEREGIDPRVAVKAARQRQSELIEERTREVRQAARKIRPRDMVDWLRTGARRNAASVTAFPPHRQAYDSEALAAAGEAVGQLPALTPETVPAMARANIVKMPETPRQRFERALRLEACAANGDPVSTEDAMWLGSYQSHAEYRSFKVMAKAFTPAAAGGADKS